jgi:hypothetical protein
MLTTFSEALEAALSTPDSSHASDARLKTLTERGGSNPRDL